MPALIRTFAETVATRDNEYRVSAFGEEHDGRWVGWLEFTPLAGGDTRLRTDHETTQGNRAALEQWAEGLEPVFLEGALTRASPFGPAA